MNTLVGKFTIAQAAYISFDICIWHEEGKEPQIHVDKFASHVGEAIPLHSKSFTSFMQNERIPRYVKREVKKRLKHGCTHVRNGEGNCLVNCGKEFSRNIRPNWKPFELPEATGIIPYGNLSVRRD